MERQTDRQKDRQLSHTQGLYIAHNCDSIYTLSLPLFVFNSPACDDTHYGKQCINPCTCERANTVDCNDVNGTCTCNAFWTGDNCTVDVNECVNSPAVCQASLQEVCRNYDGGYACDCASGYARPAPGDNCTGQSVGGATWPGGGGGGGGGNSKWWWWWWSWWWWSWCWWWSRWWRW